MKAVGRRAVLRCSGAETLVICEFIEDIGTTGSLRPEDFGGSCSRSCRSCSLIEEVGGTIGGDCFCIRDRVGGFVGGGGDSTCVGADCF